jgi:hypothetical protein
MRAAVARSLSAVALLTVMLGHPAAGAGAAGSATSDAAGVVVLVEAQGVPVTSSLVDAGGPRAQATFDSVGTSRAFASFPYPGETVVSAPGLIAGGSGGRVPAPPAYPFFVSSSHPVSPDAKTGDGPVILQAHSTATASTATAAGGLATDVATAARVLSSAAARQPDGQDAVEASAAAVVEGFAAGPLRIGQIVSTAVARRAGGDGLEKQSSLSAEGIMVGDVAVALTRDGLTVADTTAPLPSPAAVTDRLRAAGISVTYLEPVESDSGVVAAGIDVAITSAVPGPVSSVTVHYVLGRAAAHAATISALPPLGPTPDLTPPAPAVAVTAPATPEAPPTPFAVSAPGPPAPPPYGPAGEAAAAAVGGDVAVVAPADLGGSRPDRSPEEVAAPVPAVLRPTGVRVPRFDVAGPYSAFVGAAGALAACAALYARKGMAR